MCFFAWPYLNRPLPKPPISTPFNEIIRERGKYWAMSGVSDDLLRVESDFDNRPELAARSEKRPASLPAWVESRSGDEVLGVRFVSIGACQDTFSYAFNL